MLHPLQDNVDIVDGSEGETIAVNARKKKVKKTLLSLGMNVREHSDPPVIAVLGSGGGLRAMVGFLGTISKLFELNLLGAVTYIGGTSGSTWCMSSLYSENNWSDFSRMEKLLSRRIKAEMEREWTKPWEKIKEKFLGDSYSLTDLWAYTFVFSVMNTINEGKLSSHKKLCEIGEVPYPIYSAVRQDKIYENDSEAWFEFTPHKSGFPSHQCYIKTEHLACRFKEGRLLKELPEHDLIYLQGLWGSAPGADWVTLFFNEMYKKFMKAVTRAKDGTVSFCTRTWGRFKSWITGEVEKSPSSPIYFIIGVVLIRKSWSETIQDVYKNAKVMKNIVSCLAQWKWGTTNNFLYRCKHKIPENCDLFHKKHISLVDAGLENNTPYPLVLPPHRKVDLILSFDFSQGDPFQTVKTTAEYCKVQRIPFPKNTEESYEDPPTKSCYVFEGDGKETPDVMHFPLFNTQTCGDSKEIKILARKYKTRVRSYDRSMMEELLDIAKKNVESSEDQITKRIQQCVWRSNKRAG
ncbi:cytosolic phospholipase A2 gamma-like [Aquarana catesbeiana]|uniref:cytosolic phospholipase A2 gamma-like n=1 Tax=Aquarana catesbeiana TaxID=8400 RepID=UPI003CC9C998